jgi:hypothetical protein
MQTNGIEMLRGSTQILLMMQQPRLHMNPHLYAHVSVQALFQAPLLVKVFRPVILSTPSPLLCVHTAVPLTVCPLSWTLDTVPVTPRTVTFARALVST